jgi:hypothetical protein
MKAMLQEIQVFHPLAKAEEIAAANQADSDDGWEYQVVDLNNGWARVKITDDRGVVVGYL